MHAIRSLASPWKQAQLCEKFRQICTSGFYAEGPWVAQAERDLTLRLKKPTVTLSSCGSALLVMYRWYAMQGHVSVAMSNNTFMATGAMALEAGMNPVLVDCRSDDPSMSVDSLREVCARDHDIKLVCLTHVGGWIAKDYDLIAQYCRERKITLVEDCAHAFGVVDAGTHGEVACWSFYATKAVPIGEGGALSTTHPLLHEFVELFRSYGKWRDHGVIRYTKGLNLRMSEWNAAVLCTQLEDLEGILARRTADAEMLHSIAPCLLTGPTNWYKYPVAVEHAVHAAKTGAVYARSDQLDQAITGWRQPVPLINSYAWAASHACLLMGEGLYADMTRADVCRELYDSPA
jgi:dTDP-4-amino-4,6-dideoxygalactose transaminase